MKIAFLLFNNLTFLDLIGFYDPVTRLKTMGFMKELEWDMCALQPTVTDDRGLVMQASRVGGTLEDYDLIFIPGGFGTRELQHNQEYIDWVKTSQPAKWKVSVCTGSLLLGAAGFIEGKEATSHPNALEQLAPYCRQVSTERIVQDGTVLTGGGVSSSIDLGLEMVEILSNVETRKVIAKQMDYPYSSQKE